MKSGFVIVIILSFLGVAVFGMFSMNHDKSLHGGCIAAAANGTPCPEESNTLASIAFYVSAFNHFSNATLASLFAIFIAIAGAIYIARLEMFYPDQWAHFSLGSVFYTKLFLF